MPINTGTAVRELKIGPYAGGINTYSDVSAIADNELSDCVNFDIDLDGSLKSRPPWRVLNGITISNTAASTLPACYQEILLTGTYDGIRFIMFNSVHEGIAAIYIYYVDGPNAGLTLQIDPGAYSCMIRYGNDVYAIPSTSSITTQGGIKYVLDTGLVTTISSMPKGNACAIYKDRLWICGRKTLTDPSRLYFSELVNFAAAWPSSNFFDINPGDGDTLNDLIVYQDNLMLFKNGASYVLSYDTGPAQAVLQVVNADVGVQDARCVVAYENSLFLLQYNRVYEMQNFDFTRISVKVPFEYDPSVPSGISGQKWQFPRWMRLCGDRLVIRFYNIVYVYHLRLRAWSRWESEDVNISALGPIMVFDGTGTDSDLREGPQSYVATSALRFSYDRNGVGSAGNFLLYVKIFIFTDAYGADEVENGDVVSPAIPLDIKCSLLTKAYDIGVSHRFKRLMHWGVDTITGRVIAGTVYPFTIAYKVTWNQLHNYHWHELNTWGYPLFKIPSVQLQQPIGAGIARRYIRFPKSLRFRLVQFRVDMLTAGNLTDGPARVYSITAFVSGKQLAPKAVN